MATVRPLVQDNTGFQRTALPGDTVLTSDVIATLTTDGAGTILASAFTASILNRSGPSAGYTDTTDTADNIIAALSNGIGLNPGTTFRWIYRNTVAQAMTLAAGTGVTLGSNVNIVASKVRTYLITVLNGTRAKSFSANTTDTSTAVTGMSLAQTDQITVGMLVTGTGISAATTVAAVIPGSGVTLSAAATATGTPVLTFSPRISIAGISYADL